MTRESATTTIVVAALVLVGAMAWVLALRPAPRVDTTALESIPMQLGPWQSEDVPLDTAVESLLQADFNLQRRYRHPFGEVVWVYFGYYGTERGGRPEHTPRTCFQALGWTIEDHQVIDAAAGQRVNELSISLGKETQLVHYWFRSFRRTGLLGGLDQILDHLEGRLFHGRADGSLVRVSTRFEGEDRLVARSRLLQFGTAFDAMLEAHWPSEVAGDRDQATEPPRAAPSGRAPAEGGVTRASSRRRAPLE